MFDFNIISNFELPLLVASILAIKHLQKRNKIKICHNHSWHVKTNNLSIGGYYDSPWPCEDGGPARLQEAQTQWNCSGLNIQPDEYLCHTTRGMYASTMTVLGDPGEVFLLRHTVLPWFLGIPTFSWVEKLHPITLETTHISPKLLGGEVWPGSIAIHKCGDIVVVYGSYAHILSRNCELKRSLKLPIDAAYNGFVILNNGVIVTKNKSDKHPARLTLLHSNLERACDDIAHWEPSVGRMSVVGNTLYIIGITTISRYHWNDKTVTLEIDSTWQYNYVHETCQEFGWDAVIDAENIWFMDNGRHNYFFSMLLAGINHTPNRLIRVSTSDSSDHQEVEISGLRHGTITNPPLVDSKRNIIIAYDSANKYVQAYRWDKSTKSLTPIWSKKDFGCASHMVLFSTTGEVVCNDYTYWSGEVVVVLDVETGMERSRVVTGSLSQGVVFPCVGWNRDVYWTTMNRLSRIYVGNERSTKLSRQVPLLLDDPYITKDSTASSM